MRFPTWLLELTVFLGEMSMQPHPLIFLFFFFFVFCLFRTAPMAYGVSQARGLIRATTSSLCQNHSKAISEPRLQPTPQLTAMLYS